MMNAEVAIWPRTWNLPDLNGICSGIRHLFVMYDCVDKYDQYKKSLNTFKRGARNDHAKAKQAGNADVREGKEPLPFELFQIFDLLLLTAGSSDGMFAHLFLVNLMSRSKNTAEICIQHIPVSTTSPTAKLLRSRAGRASRRRGGAG